MNYKQLIRETNFEKMLNEGVYDPGIFKAFFLAGGPGSGKTFVTGNAFGGTGLKLVNSDTAFERGLSKANLSIKMPDEEEYFRNIIRQRAKTTTANQLDKYLEGRLGVVIDATGRDYNTIQRQVNNCKVLGYDCYMVFVNTSLEVALQRNQNRPRTLPEYIVKTSWDTVQQNIGKFQYLFGRSNMAIIDNNKSDKELVTDTLRKASNFVRSQLMRKPNNIIAKTWIAKELQMKRLGIK
jgi:predicted kinase